MSKRLSFQQGFSSVLLWSVLSAAFIGPGTVTTCSQAGAAFRLDLLWALTFSTLATIVLQETAARMTIASGKNLGQIVALRYAGEGQGLKWGLFLAVAFGCAAYQAGNLIGAVSGLQLLFPKFPRPLATLTLGVLAAAALWINNFSLIARILSALVAIMGLAFMWVALRAPIGAGEWVQHLVWPSFPTGSGLLVIGLVGTTIVPYNLFLGSGIGQGQSIGEMRLGIALAVGIGGLISIAILAAGVLVTGTYSYEALAQALAQNLGSAAIVLFGIGLFAAGFSSAITAPLAAAVTGQSLLGENQHRWANNQWRFRLAWGLVLAIGLGFGMLNLRPIPAIVLAQAINGVLLPLVTITLLFSANDRSLLGQYANGFWSNVLTLLIVGVTCFLGLNNLWQAFNKTFKILAADHPTTVPMIAGLSGLVALGLAWKVLRSKK
jgi:manganese transport protein